MSIIIIILISTKSTSRAYDVAYTKTPGADGNVPYRKPYVLIAVLSVELTLAECKIRLDISLITKGSTNL